MSDVSSMLYAIEKRVSYKRLRKPAKMTTTTITRESIGGTVAHLLRKIEIAQTNLNIEHRKRPMKSFIRSRNLIFNFSSRLRKIFLLFFFQLLPIFVDGNINNNKLCPFHFEKRREPEQKNIRKFVYFFSPSTTEVYVTSIGMYVGAGELVELSSHFHWSKKKSWVKLIFLRFLLQLVREGKFPTFSFPLHTVIISEKEIYSNFFMLRI